MMSGGGGGGKAREGAAGEAAAILLRYLREQNRPHSAQDAFGNLQREHGLGKTALVKALEQLTQQGKIKEKVYGKQKIYFPDQATELLDAILEGYPKSKKQFFEEVGIETDEDFHVTLPPI
ncbi:PREDICTED: homologous-pairing protein 2 homolog [Gekko japonicus]|uniref:Homologous-pairing protein 2 homolog n=1 Tax=Gekko japonicus TaxID=146911 RepID=A0ABM1L7Z4_GEKJA|nr:PREDICTED: homologous-pairing protein 2 homolog [Gekko japonicus]